MSVLSFESARYLERHNVQIIVPDLSYVTFVAKIQKAKTRKDKDYFVLRATMPKDVAELVDARPGDYMFFKVKRAQWYHMLDWEKMETTWDMLPNEIKNKVILDGLHYPGASTQAFAQRETEAPGATNLSAPIQQLANIRINQVGDVCGSSV